MTRAEALRILGLEPDATPSEIKRAYRQLVKAVHPDKNSAPNARHLFQLVQEAYEFISTIEEQEQTREKAYREATDRSEREAKARAAKERADRETRQREERVRAERERLEREAREKAVKARRVWERQRAASATGVHGCLAFILYPVMFFAIVVIFVVILSQIIGLAHGVSILIGMFPGIWLGKYLCQFIETRVTQYQLRKFEMAHPPPISQDDIPL